MLKIKTPANNVTKKCDCCGKVAVIDRVLQVENEQEFFGNLNLCFKCATQIAQDINQPIDRIKDLEINF